MISHADRMAKMGDKDIATFSQSGLLIVGGIKYPINIAISRDMEPGPVGGRTAERPRWVGRLLPSEFDGTGASVGSIIRTDERDYRIAGIDPVDIGGLQVLKLIKD